MIPVTIPNYHQSSTGMMDLTMYYNGSNDYQDMYLLQVGQSPSLSFTYYDLTNETMVYGLTTNLTYSNLNVNKKGYYYRTYTVTDGYFYNLTFRIVFKVGDPTESDRTPLEHIRYHYNTTWDDQLLSYGDINYVGGVPQVEISLQAYIYDAQGNPIQITNFIFDGVVYHHADLSWSGRALSEIKIYTTGSSIPIGVITYQYNDQGYRTSKTIDRGSMGIQTIVYTLIGSNVIYETDGTYGLIYTYDVDQSIIGFTYDPNVNASGDEEDYFFLHNQMGDVTHILDSEGNTIVHYAYDAFGNIIKTEVTSGYGAIAELNPYTYRSYRYDREIDWYYLNSRYYNPEIMRFISSDGLLGQMGDILSTNMYAYCGNNPVMHIDPNGHFMVGVMVASIVVSMLFEIAEDLVEDGDMNHSFGQYAGAFVSGIFGGLSGGFGALVGYSFLGGTIDYIISGDFNEETFVTDMMIIAVGSVISISLGSLSKKGLSTIKANKILNLGNNNLANRALNRIGLGMIKVGQRGVKQSLGTIINNSGKYLFGEVSQAVVSKVSGDLINEYGYMVFD